MRAGVFSALVGVAAASYDKFAAHPFGEYKHNPCHEFKGCDEQHKGHYFPEKDSLFFPGDHHHKGKHWDLCRDQECRDEEIYAKVDFEFKEKDIVFDFSRRENREEFFFEEVEIFLNVGEPKFDEHHRYGSHHDHCRYDDDNHYRCHLPYDHLIDGGYHGLCPHENRDAFIFYVKIKTVIKIKEERVELFNRGYNNHHGHHGHHGHHNYPRNYYGKEVDYNRNQQHQNQDHFSLGYACNECKSEQYHKECKSYNNQHKNQHYNDKEQCYEKEEYCPQKPHCPCFHKPEHHHQPHYQPHHGHDDGKWYPGKYEPVQHYAKPEHCGHFPHQKCYQKPHHPHYPRSYNNNDDFECEGAFVKAYGHGEREHHFKELSPFGYENTCNVDDGYYHRYPRSDLEVAVKGPITYDGYEFGYFAIALEKRDDKALIAIKVKVEDVEYFVAEIAVFVECDGGCNEGYEQCNRDHPSVCKPDSYPHRHHDEKGVDEFKFEIVDEFKCEGDFFIAIYVLVCVKDGDDCHYRKEFY